MCLTPRAAFGLFLALATAGSASGQHLLARMEGNDYLEMLGLQVAGAGDVNGDGWPDFSVRAGNWVATSVLNSLVHVFHGPVATGTLAPALTLTEPSYDSEFGTALSSGDVDGDGFSDLLVTAPDASVTTTGHGAAHLYRGGPSGLSAAPHWTAQAYQPLAHFGETAVIAGDVDGDGFPDAGIAAPFVDTSPGSLYAGRIFLYPGGPSGLAANPAWIADGAAQEALGRVLLSGDFDGDGFADLCVGSALGAPWSGSLQIYPGGPGSPSTAPWVVLSSPAQGYDDFGRSAAAGDFDGDGVCDLLVGAPDDSDHYGRIYVYLGSPSGLVSTPVATWGGPADNAKYGARVFVPGDLDRDGFEDALVYADFDETYVLNEGHLELVRGGDGGLSSKVVWEKDGEAAANWFGAASAGIGDVDGDGFFDFAVGASGFGQGVQQSNEGRLYVFGGDCPEAAAAQNYGSGKPGPGGVVPALVADAPSPGGHLTLSVAGGVSGVSPILLAGPAAAFHPFDGGAILVDPLLAVVLPAFDAAGESSLAVSIPESPLTCGLEAYFQVLYVEATLPGIWHTAQSPGLYVAVGD